MSQPTSQPTRQPTGPDRDSGEFQSWQVAWQEATENTAPGHDTAELAARLGKVKQSSRYFGAGLLALTIAELVFCLGVLTFGFYLVIGHPTPWRFLLLGLACVFVVVAEVFVLRNRRGTYRPRNETTQAFIELEWLRGQRQLRTIRFFLPFLALEILSISGLRIWEAASDPERAAKLPQLLAHLTLFATVAGLVFGLGCWLWQRNVRRKLRELEPLRAAFSSPEKP